MYTQNSAHEEPRREEEMWVMTIIDQWMRLRNIVEESSTQRRARSERTGWLSKSRRGEKEDRREERNFLWLMEWEKECNMQLIWLSGFRCTQFIFFILALRPCSACLSDDETRLPSHLLIKTKCWKITCTKQAKKWANLFFFLAFTAKNRSSLSRPHRASSRASRHEVWEDSMRDN